ncbi:uncharacterized protein K489DRAFT_317009 [Dissoconium aciculare CBS 342.82]|uniref:Biogenesis of lysosome-related organelles complex 1 subunit CNL1 n=1 Tax=Dissoconium aciculare CBS 342.82 TaxID=1314786 RepID=A0A6J3M924_9PEZI|nr:uncharacterized protein K489DRAFT_317009 [Dissoconium aciculare CBS 342.82]KAF1824510.1 hypothetical protein K489DRAFT_317009 [Dissoconium aciculare CBS 342.82]
MPPSSNSQLRSPPPTSPAGSVAGDRLGLDPNDLAVLHQHQQLAHAQVHSPAGSAASSQGRLLLDPNSLQLLTRHFDRIMQAIQERLEALYAATEIATQTQTDRAGNALEMADHEIARFRAILHQTDELEAEFAKISRVREIVRSFRARIEMMERRLG